MFNLLKVELHKLKSCKMLYFLILLLLIEVAGIYRFSQVLIHYKGKNAFSFSLIFQEVALMIFFSVLASDFVISDFNSGYIKNLISQGHSRKSIFISKAIAYYLGVIILSLILPLTSTVISTIMHGYGEKITAFSVLIMLRTLLIMFFVCISIASINLLLAFASMNTYITVGVIFVLEFVRRYIAPLYFVINPARKKLYFSSIYQRFTPEFVNMNTILVVLMAIVLFAFTSTLGIYLFEKADIKYGGGK